MLRRIPIKNLSAPSSLGIVALLAACLLVCCDGDGGEPPADGSPGGARARHKVKPRPVTTGTPMYESAYEMWAEEVASIEKRRSASEDVPNRLVSQAVTGIERNLQAVKVSLKAETRQNLEKKHALLRQDNAKFEELRALKGQDMQQLKKVLTDVAKGIRPLPEGRNLFFFC